MASPLQSLLDLRREAAQAARIGLEQAITARTRQDEEQARFVQDWMKARARLLGEEEAHSAGPKTAVEIQARERYRERLAEEASRAARIVRAHREGALAAAQRAESQARVAYEEARAALEAAEKLQARVDAEATKRAERRSEEAAGDHAAHVRRRERS
jgi:hypothetical protein